jgi:hypothetical protein
VYPKCHFRCKFNSCNALCMPRDDCSSLARATACIHQHQHQHQSRQLLMSLCLPSGIAYMYTVHRSSHVLMTKQWDSRAGRNAVPPLGWQARQDAAAAARGVTPSTNKGHSSDAAAAVAAARGGNFNLDEGIEGALAVRSVVLQDDTAIVPRVPPLGPVLQPSMGPYDRPAMGPSGRVKSEASCKGVNLQVAVWRASLQGGSSPGCSCRCHLHVTTS